MLRRYLGTQGVFYLILKFQIISTSLHPILLYFFVSYLDWGVAGIATSTSLSHISTFIGSYAYICFNTSVVKENSWHFINKDAFVGLIEYLRYGLPSMFLCVLEFWCFETLMLLSGLIGANTLGASVIIINIIAFLYMFPLGLSFSTSSLVGNSLGALRPGNAKMYANISIITSVVFSIVSIIFF